jgi:type IV secretory pathway protease TraF
MKMMKIWVITLLVCGCVLQQVGFLVNKSASLPYRYFVWLPNIKPGLGDITTFVHPTYGRLIKRVVGGENNVIAYDEHGMLFVAGQRIGYPQAFHHQGQLLQPIASGIIPKGYVFCAGEHENSFDSRYPLIGLIREEALQGTLWGIE